MFDIKSIRSQTGDKYAQYTDEQLAQAMYKGLGIKAPFEEVAPTLFGYDPSDQFSRRFGQAVDELQGSLYGAAGLAGDALGINSLKDWGLNNAQEQFQQSAQQSRFNDDLTNFSDENFSTGDYLAGGLGYVGGNLLTSLAGGGIGGAVGKQVAKKAAMEALETAATKTASQLAKKGIQKDLIAEAKDKAGQAAFNAVSRKAAERGAITGASGLTYAQSAGNLYNDLAQQGDENAVAKSLGYAAPIAALDILPQARLFKGLTKGVQTPDILTSVAEDSLKKKAAKFAGRAGYEGTKQGGLESATELGQGMIERFATNKDVLNANAMINEGALGFLGGGVGGAAVGGFRNKPDEPVELTTRQRIGSDRRAILNKAIEESKRRFTDLNTKFDADTEQGNGPAGLSGFQGPAVNMKTKAPKVTTTNATTTPVAEISDEQVAGMFGLSPTLGSDGTVRALTVGDKTLGTFSARKYLADLKKSVSTNPTVAKAVLAASQIPEMPTADGKLLNKVFRELGVEKETSIDDLNVSLDAKLAELTGSSDQDAARQVRLYSNIKNVINGQAVDSTVIESASDGAPVQVEAGTTTPAPAPTQEVPPPTGVAQPSPAPFAGNDSGLPKLAEFLATEARSKKRNVDKNGNLKEGVVSGIARDLAILKAIQENEGEGKIDYSQLGYANEKQFKTAVSRARKRFGLNDPDGVKDPKKRTKIKQDNANTLERLRAFAEQNDLPFVDIEQELQGLRANLFRQYAGLKGEGRQVMDVSQAQSTSVGMGGVIGGQVDGTEDSDYAGSDSGSDQGGSFGESEGALGTTEDGAAFSDGYNSDKSGVTDGGTFDSIMQTLPRAEADLEKATRDLITAEQEGGNGKQGAITALSEQVQNLQNLVDTLKDAKRKYKDDNGNPVKLNPQQTQLAQAMAGVIEQRLDEIAPKDQDGDRIVDVNRVLGTEVASQIKEAATAKKEEATKPKRPDDFEEKFSEELGVAISSTGSPQLQNMLTPARLERNAPEVANRLKDKFEANGQLTAADIMAEMDELEKAVKKGWKMSRSGGPQATFTDDIDDPATELDDDGYADYEEWKQSMADLEAEQVREDNAIDVLTDMVNNVVSDTYQGLGIGNAVFQTVNQFHIQDLSKDEAEGVYDSDTRSIYIDIGLLNDAGELDVEIAVHHELGHAIDYAYDDTVGQFSGRPEFRIALDGDGYFAKSRNAHGPLVKEILQAMERQDLFEDHFAYPVLYTWETEQEARAEMFSQAWAFYMLSPKTAELMFKEMPQTASMIQGIIDELQQVEGQINEGTARQVRPIQENQTRNSEGGSKSSLRRKAKPSSSTEQESGGIKKLQGLIDENIPPIVGKPLNAVISTLNEYIKKGSVYLAPTKDLAAMAGKLMKSAPKVAELFDAKNAKIAKLVKRYNDTFMAYQDLPEAQKKLVNAEIYRATKEKDNGYQTSPTYNALSSSGKKIVDDVFAIGKRDATEEKAKFIAELEAKKADFADDEAMIRKLDNAIADITEQYRKMISGPYAPFVRSGDYLLIAKSQEYIDSKGKERSKLEKDGDHYIVEFFESASERDARERQLNRDGEYAEVRATSRDQFRSEAFSGPAVMEALNRIRAMVPDRGRGESETNKMVDRTNSLLDFVYLQGIAENNIRNSRRYRKYITGADTNMMRGFATSGQSRARYIAGLEFDAEINRVFKQLREEKNDSDLSDADKVKADRYTQELFARHISGTPQTRTGVQALLRMSSLYHLSVSPAYYLINATQPYMVSLPFMAGRFGWRKTASAVNKAYGEVSKLHIFRKGGLDDINGYRNSSDVRGVIQKIIDDGWLDVTMVEELGNLDMIDGNGNAVVKGVKKAELFLRNMQRRVEVANRVATAVAAYRLSKGNLKYAREVVDRTQGDYSDWNAPRAMRTNIGKVATQFRKFQLMQATLLLREFGEYRKNAKPEERAIAGRAVKFMLAHSIVMAGAKGLPFIGAAVALAQMMTGSDEDEETLIRRALGNNPMSDLLTRGLPNAMGVDLSGRVGFGTTFSIFPYADIKANSGGVRELAFAAFGPLGAVIDKWARASEYAGIGEWYKAAETASPSGISNVMKAGRQASSGMTNKKGDTILPASEVSFMDTALKGLGFNSSEMALRQWASSQTYKAEQGYRDKENKLKTRYAIAKKEGDSAELRDLRLKWRELQKEKREKGLKVSPLSTLLSAPKTQRKRERENIGGVQANSRTSGYAGQLVQ